MIVRGLYPLIARVSMAERSMIMLLVIEYLASMLPDELSHDMEGQWFSPGDLEDLVCMAATIAYKLMPETSKLVQFVGDVFEQAVQSCRAREDVLGLERFHECHVEEHIDPPREVHVHGGTLAAAAEAVRRSGGDTHTVVPTETTERQSAMRVPVPPPPQSSQPDVPISARQRMLNLHNLVVPAGPMVTDNDRQTSPPYAQEPVPVRRSTFVESERRDVSQTPAWMFLCEECGGAFVEAEKLRLHREAVHSVWPDQRPTVRSAQPNAPAQPSASPEVAQMQSQMSALTSLVSQMRSMMSGDGGDERPLAQRRTKRSTAGNALCKECNFPTKFCECDISAESDVDVRPSRRSGNGSRARNALSSIAGLALTEVFKRRRILLVPDMWLPYLAAGAQPRDLRAALEARYVNEKRYNDHETIKANNRHSIETIMLAVTAALAPMEFAGRDPHELDVVSLLHTLRYLQENRVRAKGGEKAAQMYRETVENDSGPDDERRAEAAGDKVSAKAEEIRKASRNVDTSGSTKSEKKGSGRYKRCPDAQWTAMSAAERIKWRKDNPL